MLTTLEPTQSLNRYIRDGDNPELTEERLKASFDTEELAAVFYGGKQRLNRRRHLLHNVDIRPDLQDTKPQGHLSREEKYENQMRKSVQMIRHLPAFANPLDAWELMQVVREVTGAEGYGMSIHHMMFIPTLQNMLDEEQISWWLQKAVDGQIIGTYCQTEMGHGTNLSKLETIASYDPSTEEFVLHTPTITSLKWWPGGLGQTVNHVALVANLVTEGKNFGPHFFMVQIREMETHKPLPGIRVGDIGAKMGIKGVDNGFLGFDHYRIPRRNMLMKYSQVEKDGTYRPPLHAKIAYSTMTIIRTELVLLQVLYMQYATTIATRYSCIRRQGEIMKGEGEVKLIEYQTQQNRLIPCIAKTYAFLFAATEVQKMTSDIMEDMKNHKVNNGILADLHAISCCLKAYTTFEGTKIQEQCRFACGGHGFSEASFLPTLYNCAVAGCTMEGDNLVMLLQTARYLMKAAMMAKTGQGIGPSVEFLLAERQQQSLVGHVPSGDYAHYLQDFEHLARKQIFRAFDRMLTLSESGLPTAVAWTENQIELTRASRSFIRLFIARSYVKSVSEVTDRPTRSILTDLLAVSMSQDLISQTKYLLEDGYMSPKQVSALKEDQYCLLKKLRPQAVSLVDSFDCTDRELRSVLGRRDGHVYENLLDWALQSKMNQNKNGVNPSFEKYIKPMVMGYQSKL